jgi:hypothetical protein
MFDQKFAFIIEERAGGFLFPPKIFERFWWPYTLEIHEGNDPNRKDLRTLQDKKEFVTSTP